MRNFREFKIWEKSIQIVIPVYQITKSFPTEEKFGLTSQMRRASVSIASNIAEGCSRQSSMEFKRFLDISLGSAYELETQLIISGELDFITKDQLSAFLPDLIALQKQINALINKLRLDLH